MKRKFAFLRDSHGPAVLRKALSLTTVCGVAALAVYCKSTSQTSGLKDDYVIQKDSTAPKVYEMAPGDYVIKLNNAAGIKNGQQVTLKFGVTQKWDAERIACDSLANTDRSAVAKIEGEEVVFRIKTNPKQFERCGTDGANKGSRSGRKLSLACQKDSDWQGPKMLEACVLDSAGKAVAGGRGAPTRLAQGLGLADTEEHVNTVLSMGKACARRLGPLPRDWSCLDGAIIPVTQNGKEVRADCAEGDDTCIDYLKWQPTDKCDNPAYLGLGDQGQCTPFSRLGRLYTKKDVELIFICRRYKIGNKVEETDARGNVTKVSEHLGPDVPLHQDVAIVQHNIKSGETCFSQALSGFQADGRDLPTARVPPPHEVAVPDDIVKKYAHLPEKQRPAAAPSFWIKPTDAGSNPNRPGFQCIICHDSDPFMHSPHVDQVNFDHHFKPSKEVRFAVNGHEGIKRTSANLKNTIPTDEAGNPIADEFFNFDVGTHPFAGRSDKMVPCNPGKKGNGVGELSNPQCLYNKGEENSATGKYSQVHDVHQKTFPDTWAVIPKNTDGGVDDTCVKCHRVGSATTCRTWAGDSVGDLSALFGSVGNQKTETAKAFHRSHWMPMTGKYPSDEFYKDYKNKSCQPDPANPGQFVGECVGSEEDWTQKFATAKKRILECCSLANDVGSNQDPNGSSAFTDKCIAQKITSKPAHTGRHSSNIEAQEITEAVSFREGDSVPIRLTSPGSGKVDYIGFAASLSHKRCGDVKISLMKNNNRVTLFDGNLKYRNRPCDNLRLSVENADDSTGFSRIIGSTSAADDYWQLIIEDRFKNEAAGEISNIKIEIGLK